MIYLYQVENVALQMCDLKDDSILQIVHSVSLNST